MHLQLNFSHTRFGQSTQTKRYRNQQTQKTLAHEIQQQNHKFRIPHTPSNYESEDRTTKSSNLNQMQSSDSPERDDDDPPWPPGSRDNKSQSFSDAPKTKNYLLSRPQRPPEQRLFRRGVEGSDRKPYDFFVFGPVLRFPSNWEVLRETLERETERAFVGRERDTAKREKDCV